MPRLSDATYSEQVTQRTRDCIQFLQDAGFPHAAVALDFEFAVRDGLIPAPTQEGN